MLQTFAHPAQKARGIRPVYNPVVKGEGQRQKAARFEIPVNITGHYGCTADPEDGSLGPENARRKTDAADATLVG